jgi:hypothetical protein
MNTNVNSRPAFEPNRIGLFKILLNPFSSALSFALASICFFFTAPDAIASSQSITLTVGPGANDSNPMLWKDTGIDLSADTIVTILASGLWTPNGSDWCGPGGTNDGSTDTFVNTNHASLVAFVGSNPYAEWGNSSFFPQDSSANGFYPVGIYNQFTNTSSGELWLGFNDDALSLSVSDNSGSVTALVRTNDPNSFEIVNVQFGYPFNETTRQTGTAAVGTGTKDYWNLAGADPNRDGSPPSSFEVSCRDSRSNSTSITVTASCETDMVGAIWGTEESLQPLLNGGALTAGGSAFDLNITVPAGTWDMYFYSLTGVSDGSRQPSTFSLPDTGTPSQTPSSSDYAPNIYVLGNQYVVFYGMPGGGTYTWEVSSDSQPYCNGLQLVEH